MKSESESIKHINMHRHTYVLTTLISSIALSLAHPQPLNGPSGSNYGNDDGRGRNDDGDANENYATPMLVVNTELVPLTIHENYGTSRLWYPDGIERVRIDDAPPGYGCFFWSRVQPTFASDPEDGDTSTSSSPPSPSLSDSSSSLSSSSSSFSFDFSPPNVPGTSLLQDTFVSETFYSSSSSSSHDFTMFDPPLAPEYLTCFNLPEPTDPDGFVAVWIESYSSPATVSASEPEDEDSEPSRIPKYTLIQVPLSNSVSDGRFGGVLFPQMIELRRAALVHLPKRNAQCIPIRGSTEEREEDRIIITDDEQLLTPVSDAVGLVCSAEN